MDENKLAILKELSLREDLPQDKKDIVQELMLREGGIQQQQQQQIEQQEQEYAGTPLGLFKETLPGIDKISKLMGQGMVKGVAGAGDLISAGLTTAYNQLPFVQQQDINYGQLADTIDTSGYVEPQNILEHGAEFAGAMLSGQGLAPTGINIVNEGVDKVFGAVAEKAAPLIKGIIGKVGKNSSEKAINYIIKNPEVALKPAVQNTELFPSTFQQSYKAGFKAFKNIKKEVGSSIGNIKAYAKANAGTLKTDISDIYKSVSDEIASGAYEESGKVSKLLKTIQKTMKDDIVEFRKVNKNGVEYTEEVFTDIDFNSLDKLFTKITNSDAWSDSILTKGFKLSSGQNFGLEAVNGIKNRLYGLYDEIPDLSSEFAQKRGAYKALKDLEFKAKIDEPEDIAAAFIKALTTGNEDLFDSLYNILPKDVFDKNMSTILNMSKKKWSEFLSSRGYVSGGGTLFATAPLEYLEAGAGRLLAAGQARPTNYALSGGANFEKALAKGGKNTVKTISELLKVAPRFIGQ